MKAKHTPAPWRIASSNFDNGFYVIHANDNTSATPRELQVVKLDYGSHPNKYYLEKAEANAKLIAAAPELLEALQELIKVYEQKGQLLSFDVSIARNAISKATE